MERIARLHHAAVPGDGATIALDPDESHHAVRVLRVRPGDPVSVFDGLGREWDAVVVSAGRDRAEVRIVSERSGRVDPKLEVVLYQALCRPERMEWVIQKGTEVGLAAIRPFEARRADVPAPSTGRMERYRRVAMEAAKQCGRRLVPVVADPVEAPPPPPEGFAALWLDASPGAPPIAERLLRPRPRGVWLVVGPEGGLEPDEALNLGAAGWLASGLGPRTLRTETAGAIAAAIVLHAWGDLGSTLRG